MLIGNNPPEAATRLWFCPEPDVRLHQFRYSAGRLDCLPHTHDEYNIIFCMCGTFDYAVRGTHVSLKAGDVLVVNPGEMHFGRYGPEHSGSMGLALHVSIRTLKEMMRRMRLPTGLDQSRISFLDKVRDPVMIGLGEELLRELDQRQNGFDLMAQALVVKVLVHLLRHSLHPTIEPGAAALPRQLPSWQMVRALEYMNANRKNAFSVAELCSNAGTSTTRFIQLFKNSAAGGMSPHAFYNALIVHKAKRLLRESGCSIKEVSYELGFQNESHFCKVFRSCTGTTPGNFRILGLPKLSTTSTPDSCPR